MIREIRILDLGVIAEARLEFAEGLTVITGETGAGKTMVLQGLGLLSGSKSDPQTVRRGAREAVVEGIFDIEGATQLVDQSLVSEHVTEVGGVVEDDGSVVVVRTVAAQGRSRTLLGGRTVPQAVLSEVVGSVVAIHGQSDQMRLRSHAHQRDTLDRYAGSTHGAMLDMYRALWTERTELDDELAALREQSIDRAREADLLRLGLAEVERISPQPSEDTELSAEAEKLRHAEELGSDVSTARDVLDIGEQDQQANMVTLLDQAIRAVERAADVDNSLAPTLARLRDIAFSVADVVADLSGYLASLGAEPGRLEQVEERRSDLGRLTRSYGATINEVLAWAERAELRLLDLQDDGERISGMEYRLTELDQRLNAAAAELSDQRREAALRMSQAVDVELGGLAMSGAHFDVTVTASEDLGPWGGDQIEMLLAAHPGAPLRPLGKSASGGELSRIMLAIEVVLADGLAEAHGTAKSASTSAKVGAVRRAMIFDEVDAGVGGQAAQHVGARLARLAVSQQVIVITHLAQVAAYADTHLVVRKSTAPTGEVTESDVQLVVGDERLTELARMLAGEQDSVAARTHADELLQAAAMRR